MRKHNWKKKIKASKFFEQEQNIRFTEQKVILSIEDNISEINWNFVESIHKTPKGILIKLGSGILFLPFELFPSQKAIDFVMAQKNYP